MQPCIMRAVCKHFNAFNIQKKNAYITHLFGMEATYNGLIMKQVMNNNCVHPKTFFNHFFDNHIKYTIFVYPLSTPVAYPYYARNDLSIFGIPNYKSCIPFNLPGGSGALFTIGKNSESKHFIFNGLKFCNQNSSQTIAIYIFPNAKSVQITCCSFYHCRILAVGNSDCCLIISQCEFNNDSESVTAYGFKQLIITDNIFKPRLLCRYEEFANFRYGHITFNAFNDGFVEIARNKFFCEPIAPIIMLNNNGVYNGPEVEDRCGFRIAAQIDNCLVNNNTWIFLPENDARQHDKCECRFGEGCKKLRLQNMVYLDPLARA